MPGANRRPAHTDEALEGERRITLGYISAGYSKEVKPTVSVFYKNANDGVKRFERFGSHDVMADIVTLSQTLSGVVLSYLSAPGRDALLNVPAVIPMKNETNGSLQ